MTIICYPRCSTCKRAVAFLEAHNIAYTYRDIKEENPTEEELAEFLKKSELPPRRFFNTSGQLYRQMGLKDQVPTMETEAMLALLSTDGMLVKRPLLITEDRVLVGFKEAEWREVLL